MPMANNAHQDDLLAGVLEQIEACEMFAQGDRWLLAVSGGADSMALMHIVASLRDQGSLKLQYIHIAHLNHQLRGNESDADAAFVAEQAKKLSLEVTNGTADINNLPRASGESIETAARRYRYEFLAETAAENHCNKIALAHHANDNVETILQRIIRGTGVRGLAGIPAVRKLNVEDTAETPILIVRPMLNLRRKQIEEFMRKGQLPYRVDSSNLSKTPFRNRVRHDLIPMLASEYNPKVFEAIERLSYTATWVAEILSCDAKADYLDILQEHQGDRVVLDAQKLHEKPMIQQTEIIHHALSALHIPLRRIGYKHIAAVLRRIAKNNQQTWQIQLPGSVIVSLDSTQLAIEIDTTSRELDIVPLCQITLTLQGSTTLPEGYVGWNAVDNTKKPITTIAAQSEQINSVELANLRSKHEHYQESLDAEQITGALLLRTRQRGDRFRPLGAPGFKTIGDFFTDQKVPEQLRDRIPLLCDDQGVVWVIGMRIAERVKVTKTTKNALKLSAT